MVSIILIGESSVGKSSLIRRYHTNEFTTDFYTTLGTDFITKKIEIDSRTVSAQIWDTAGQERFSTITKNFYKRADAILLVYDMTKEESFLKISKWVDNLKDNVSNKVPRCLAANKKDLEEERQITLEMGMEKAKELNMTYFETSARTGENIDKLFKDVIEKAYNMKTSKVSSAHVVLNNDNKSMKNRNCCK